MRSECLKMATEQKGALPKNFRENVDKCKLFVVGAGGIGCELLKNLVLTGFEDIELVSIAYFLREIHLNCAGCGCRIVLLTS